MEFKLTAKTDVGKVRDHNEDNYVVCPDLESPDWFISNDVHKLGQKGSLMVIADGMGGLNAGEVASAIAIESIQQYLSQKLKDKDLFNTDIKNILFQAINYSQEQMVSHAKEFPETKGMGTTIVMALIKDNILHTAWVGDSRCYVFRNNRELFFATKDHSFVQQLIDKGKLSTQEAFHHPDSNIITRSLGDETSNKSNPDFGSFPLVMGDRVLLCSDGLNAMLEDEMIAAILHEEQEIKGCAERLITEANTAGGVDNITVTLFDILSLSEIDNADIKLFELAPAAIFNPPSSDFNPFNTLKKNDSSKDEIQTLTKSIISKKPNWIIILSLTILVSLFYIWYSSFSRTNKYPVKPTSDTTKPITNKVNNLPSGNEQKKNEPASQVLEETSKNADNNYKSVEKPAKQIEAKTKPIGSNKVDKIVPTPIDTSIKDISKPPSLN